jgi:hypothetical protein
MTTTVTTRNPYGCDSSNVSATECVVLAGLRGINVRLPSSGARTRVPRTVSGPPPRPLALRCKRLLGADRSQSSRARASHHRFVARVVVAHVIVAARRHYI